MNCTYEPFTQIRTYFMGFMATTGNHEKANHKYIYISDKNMSNQYTDRNIVECIKKLSYVFLFYCMKNFTTTLTTILNIYMYIAYMI